MRFRKKPVVIEAFQNGFDVEPDWFKARTDIRREPLDHHTDIVIQTLEGEMRASFGDWIIKGVANEVYPCKSEIFEATYELAEDQK